MPYYVTLGRWTEQGVKTLKTVPQRVAAVRAATEAAGGKLHYILAVMGQYDVVAVAEAPSDEVATRLAIQIAQAGNLRTETLRAYTPEEFAKLVP